MHAGGINNLFEKVEEDKQKENKKALGIDKTIDDVLEEYKKERRDKKGKNA